MNASEKFTAICEILDMPFWKHRYEMYSAWVFTCIAESVSDLGLSYNVLGGVLQFKFSGALLARVNIPDVEFEIWAEKRYEAENLVGEGRKKHIQPDYSIMKRCNGAGEACLLIECKQYKKSNSRNFAIAVNDYARSRPDANVLLVNYGPISRNLSMRIGSDVRRRYRGYEKMKPLTARRAEFVRDVRDMIDACWADIQFSAGRDLILWEEKPEQLKVELSWNQLPTDLDLSVFSGCLRKRRIATFTLAIGV